MTSQNDFALRPGGALGLVPTDVVISDQVPGVAVEYTQSGEGGLGSGADRGIPDQPRIGGAHRDRVRGPGSGCPCSSVSLWITLVGVSSAHRTSSARSAVFIASSNPAAARRWAKRSRARATNPVETGAPSSAAIRCAVRSTGTLPSMPSRIAASLTFGP